VWEHEAAREYKFCGGREGQRWGDRGHVRGARLGRADGGRRREEEGGGMYSCRSRRRCVGRVEIENGVSEVSAIGFPDRSPLGYLCREGQDTSSSFGRGDTGSRGRVAEVQELPVKARAFSAPLALRGVDKGTDGLQGADARGLPVHIRSGNRVAALGEWGMVWARGGGAEARRGQPAGDRRRVCGCGESGSRHIEEAGSSI
jgi:hypothetical protein